MTECERIIKQGILPKIFFEPETICDFYVDEKKKKVWAIELDLLHEFGRVCQEHGLKYFMIFGSLLGAVRHGGFIPWDDDMDVIMPRSDYEVLLNLKDEFKTPYFLQTCYTDHGFYYAHAKLRNSNTSAIDYPFLYQGFNLGIFIDILPLDNFDPVDGVKTFNEINELILENSVAMRLSHPNLSVRDKERVKKHKGLNPIEVFQRIDSLSKQSNEVESGYVSILSATTYGLKKDVFPKRCFHEQIEWKYNGIDAFIPNGYKDVLRITYGDYMQFPSVEERGKWHSNLDFYPDLPYSVVVNRIINNDIDYTLENE